MSFEIQLPADGRITIPKPIRDALQIKAGERFDIRCEDGVLVFRRLLVLNNGAPDITVKIIEP